MKPDYYNELYQLTEAMCHKYSADSQVEAAMVTGSVSLGQVDAASDVDMMLYYRELPTTAGLAAIKEEALASGGGIYGYDPAEGLACYFFEKGVKVDIAFQKTADFAQLITEFAHKPDLTEKNKLIMMSGIQQCLPLCGTEIIQGWQQQLANLPTSFFEELVQKHLRFPPAAVLQNMGIDRQDYGFVYELLLEAAGNMLNVLCGLNGLIPPGKIKGMGIRLDKLAIKPDNLAERVKQLWLLPPQEVSRYFYQIVQELLALVDYHMPLIGTQAARERLFLQLRQNEEGKITGFPQQEGQIMFTQLPDRIEDFMGWTWPQMAPFYEDLAERPLTDPTLTDWLKDWTKLGQLIGEWQSRLYVATTQNTASDDAEAALNQFMADIYPHVETAENSLKQRLLQSGLRPDGLDIALQQMQVDAELFTEANIPLAAESIKLSQRYNKIIGAQTVVWAGEELTLTQLSTQLQTPDRAVREEGWRRTAERRLQDRSALNELWQEMYPLRQRMAHNAGHADYREYVWREKKRFDYTPEDAATFHEAILAVAVPAASRVYARYGRRLGVERLRPWDVAADVFPYSLPALRPFTDFNEFADISTHIFRQVDPILGTHFETMRQENMLDLPNRKGKAPGAYCAYYPVTQRPFIFMNSVGTGEDVRTLLHEAGHAFHGFAITPLPYRQQKRSPMEFSEVASMAMELLASPYLARENGGFFTSAELRQWQTNHLERIILFWPYMAVVDAFQHWAYTNKEGSDAAACDAQWSALWQKYIPDIDFSGLEDVMMTGWHRKQHIFRGPFYYIEYGLAQLGALQVWRNALQDQAGAVKAYREALALGGTRPLPELYATANTRFALDETIMTEMVELLEEQLHHLEDDTPAYH